MLNGQVTQVEHFGNGRRIVDTYVVPVAAISLYVRGVTFYRIDGQNMDVATPFLVIHPPNTQVELGNTPERDCWSLRFSTDEIRPAKELGGVEIRFENDWIRVPTLTHLTTEGCARIEAEFRCISQWSATPVPAHQFRARLGFISLLRHVMDAHLAVVSESAPMSFKRLIDQDRGMKHSLAVLCRQCGYSPNRLRVLFEQQYGMAPLAYRNRIRMQRVLSMVQDTDLPFKDIARNTGFRQMSHFSALFRQFFNKSPREARLARARA